MSKSNKLEKNVTIYFQHSIYIFNMKRLKEIIKEQVSKVFTENYPLGADQDSRAPWRQEEGLSIVSFEPNYNTGNFAVNLNDGQEVYIDFEPIIEQYFKNFPGSSEHFGKMFPESDNIYSDIVKYLSGQGYEFKNLLENEIDYLVSNGEIETKEHEKEYELDEEDNNNNTIKRDKFVIYKVVHTKEKPFYKNEIIDFAEDEGKAKEKEDMYRNTNTDDNVIEFFSERPMPIQSRFHLNEKRR